MQTLFKTFAFRFAHKTRKPWLTSTPSQRISIIQTPLNKLIIQNPGCYWTTLFKNLLGIMIFAKFKKGLSCFGHCLSLWMFSWVGRIGGAFESFGLEVFRQNSLVRTHWVWFQSFELLIGFNSLVFLVAVSVQPRHLGQLWGWVQHVAFYYRRDAVVLLPNLFFKPQAKVKARKATR